ncbi:unnamed protein product, partial [Laminaria digitata]
PSQGGLSSEGFANLAAAVFVSRGFRVFLMAGTVATPLVAFGVCYTEACAGVMVTASHNPKKDNGYKVYWSNGSQIIPPHDAGESGEDCRELGGVGEVRPSKRHRRPPVLRPDRTPGGGVLSGDRGRAVPEARGQRSLRDRGD